MHLREANEEGLPEGLFSYRKPNLFLFIADLKKNYSLPICKPLRYAREVINGKPSAPG